MAKKKNKKKVSKSVAVKDQQLGKKKETAREKMIGQSIGYNVSGVYSMVKSASKENLIDEIDVTMEILYSIKRAGATAIITYNAIEIAKKINKK